MVSYKRNLIFLEKLTVSLEQWLQINFEKLLIYLQFSAEWAYKLLS